MSASTFADMRRINGDFDNAIKTAPDGTLPTIAFYGHRSGPFRGDGAKLKNEYVWQLPAEQVAQWELDLRHVAPRR